jgi:hypothetical protein
MVDRMVDRMVVPDAENQLELGDLQDLKIAIHDHLHLLHQCYHLHLNL